MGKRKTKESKRIESHSDLIFFPEWLPDGAKIFSHSLIKRFREDKESKNTINLLKRFIEDDVPIKKMWKKIESSAIKATARELKTFNPMFRIMN